jgi:hypothetical protein
LSDFRFHNLAWMPILNPGRDAERPGGLSVVGCFGTGWAYG